MTHAPLDDWARLSDEWRAQPRTDAVDFLRRRVRRQTMRLYMITAFEVLITLAGGGIVVAAFMRGPDLETRLLAGGLGLFTAIVWGFTLRNRRGIWRAAGDTLAAYRALERERLRRRIANARFTWQICAAALIPMVALAVRRIGTGGPASMAAVISAAGCLYLIAWIVWSRALERRLADRMVPVAVDE
jgi:drug/metabolite transporter (DMT)-like permease